MPICRNLHLQVSYRNVTVIVLQRKKSPVNKNKKRSLFCFLTSVVCFFFNYYFMSVTTPAVRQAAQQC